MKIAPLAIVLSSLLSSTALAQTAGGPPAQPAAATASEAAPPSNDPLEGTNRTMFGVYRVLDTHAIRPAAIFYERATPRPIRRGLRNAFRNLGEPVVFVNDVLQLHVKAAGTTLGRFALNSTVGMAGLFDLATSAELPYHANGFGTTLGRYGAAPGPYLFIPVLGPSDVRDTIGGVVDALTDPFTWLNYPGRVGVGVSRGVIGGLDARAEADPELKVIFATATDPYASIRSLYLQNRQSQITGGEVNVDALPSFGDEPTSPPNQAGAPGAAPAPVPEAPTGDARALPSQIPPTTEAGAAAAQDQAPASQAPAPSPPQP